MDCVVVDCGADAAKGGNRIDQFLDAPGGES